MIRRATYADLPAVFELGMRLKRQSPYVTVPVDKEVAMKALRNCLASAQGCLFVAEHTGQITGAFVGVAEQLWYSSKRWATDLMFYSLRRGDGERLIAAFLDWAFAHPNVVDVTLGVSSNRHARVTDRWYLAQGFARVGGLYQMGRFDRVKEIAA